MQSQISFLYSLLSLFLMCSFYFYWIYMVLLLKFFLCDFTIWNFDYFELNFLSNNFFFKILSSRFLDILMIF
jgi:hypothetical protein